jgi:hypothetical protein
MQLDVLLLPLYQDVKMVILFPLQIHVLLVLLELKLVPHLLLLHVKMDFSKDRIQLVVVVVELVLQPAYQQHKHQHVVQDFI